MFIWCTKTDSMSCKQFVKVFSFIMSASGCLIYVPLEFYRRTLALSYICKFLCACVLGNVRRQCCLEAVS